MSCADFRHDCLESPDPDNLDRRQREHLAACPNCRAWHARLVRLENHVPMIPTPRSQGKERFKQQFLGTSPAKTPVSKPAASRKPTVVPQRRMSRVAWVASGVVALAVLVAVGVWLGGHLSDLASPKQMVKQKQTNPTPEPTPVVPIPYPEKSPSQPQPQVQPKAGPFDLEKQVLALNIELAQTQSHSERKEILANLMELVRKSDSTPDLVSVLVENALQLARADHPMDRADLCKNLAKSLTDEIQSTSKRREYDKTAELSSMLETVLVDGVAYTLYQAQTETPVDSPKLALMTKVSDQVAEMAQQAEQAIAANVPEKHEMRERVVNLQNAMKEVKNQSHGKGPPKMPPGHLKKHKKK